MTPAAKLRPTPKDSPGGSGLAFVLRALNSRNYRLFFAGQSISLIGSWMTRLATSWLVYRLTGSALLLGIVGFAGQIPTFLLGPFAGVIVDKMDRRSLLVGTQALAMLQSLVLAALTLTNRITYHELLFLGAFQGIINAFDTPGRQSFVIQMVDKREDLSNAIALNSSMVNGARLIGPTLAGIVIAKTGEGWCFLIDGVSYIAVIISLLLMIVPRAAAGAPDRRKPPVRDQLAEGWQYVIRFTPIRNILLLLSLVSIVGMPYTILMPVFATRILHGGPNTLGQLMAATGVGALAGALYLASRKSVVGLGKLIPRMTCLFGAGLIAFSFSHSFLLSLCLMPIIGFGFMVQMASSNTLLQTIVDEDKRGRVMSFYAMAFLGTAPFGSLLGGALASRIGAPFTVAIGGVGCLLGASAFMYYLPTFRQVLHPIYVRMGLVPAIAAGVENTAEMTDAVGEG